MKRVSPHKEADDYKAKIEGDVKMAASQAVQATRSDIENLVVAKIADTEVEKALSSETYLKGIITAVAQKFSAEEPADLALVLPVANVRFEVVEHIYHLYVRPAVTESLERAYRC